MVMRTRLGVLAVAAAVSMATAGITAQSRPDFTGIWVAQPGTNPATPPPQVMGQQFSIWQTQVELTIARTIGSAEATMQVPLDGREVRVRMPARRLCEADSVSLYSAGWEGEAIRLALRGVVPPGGNEPLARDSTYTLTLSSPDTLTLQLQNIAAGQPPRTFTTVYKRTGAPPSTPPAPAAAKATASIVQLAWLPGLWISTRGADTIEERWTTPAGGSMLALSRTVRGSLMVEFEFLCIVERDGGLVYTAMPNGRQPPTDFVLTSIEANGATFENPAHDFPKVIRYAKKADGTLEATISGAAGQKAITFLFKKQE